MGKTCCVQYRFGSLCLTKFTTTLQEFPGNSLKDGKLLWLTQQTKCFYQIWVVLTVGKLQISEKTYLRKKRYICRPTDASKGQVLIGN